MIKVVLLVKRKPDLTREEFRRYYEASHAPLAAQRLRGCIRYVRNFVVEEISGQPGLDCITEFWYDLDGSWREVHAQIASDASRELLQEDEAKFMDRDSFRVVVVVEAETATAALQA